MIKQNKWHRSSVLSPQYSSQKLRTHFNDNNNNNNNNSGSYYAFCVRLSAFTKMLHEIIFIYLKLIIINNSK